MNGIMHQYRGECNISEEWPCRPWSMGTDSDTLMLWMGACAEQVGKVTSGNFLCKY